MSEFFVGQNQQADRVLMAWRDEYSAEEVNLGGKTVRIFGEDESPTEWLRDTVGIKPLANHTQQVWAGNLGGTRQLRGKLPRTEGLLLSKPSDTEQAKLLKALESRARSKQLGRMAMQNGCGITMRDRDGKPRAIILQQKEGSKIILKDAEGKDLFSAPE